MNIDPQAKLLSVVEEALEDACCQRSLLETDGRGGTPEHLILNAKIARWELVWRLFR
ncbi:hypothetical protein [Janthinobacterium sp. NKUCC06_STL]|uniref:hypothetical protein n=1 Tax=Janthinobacterium sp. NKUCC06_STL TaxID=2842127 RepID=UPI001C5B4646|nr:hypothetical protein [Janthinobacterium sp. NKUCC06_STL]MBW3512076.1 hypothetical protein [Janthinobacterium sp. NKUCC06_STL]